MGSLLALGASRQVFIPDPDRSLFGPGDPGTHARMALLDLHAPATRPHTGHGAGRQTALALLSGLLAAVGVVRGHTRPAAAEKVAVWFR